MPIPDFLTPNFFEGVGLVAFCAFICWWFLAKLVKGDLRTDREFKSLETDRDHWRDAFFTEQKAHAVTSTQNTELVEIGRLQQYTIEAGMREAEMRKKDTT